MAGDSRGIWMDMDGYGYEWIWMDMDGYRISVSFFRDHGFMMDLFVGFMM